MAVIGAVERASEQAQPNDRLGGARGDFVANLGRRGAEISATLRVLGERPDDKKARAELRRRLHALHAGAKLLKFPRLAEELGAAEQALEDGARHPEIAPMDLERLASLVQEMPRLAWGDPKKEEPPRIHEPSRPADPSPEESTTAALALAPEAEAPVSVDAPSGPLSALVVGQPHLAEALAPLDSDHDHAVEVEQTTDLTVAIDLARALAPDVLVVDGDVHGARELIEALAADALTEPIPAVVVGTFDRPEQAGRFLALGVAKTLPKPVSPSALLAACKSAVATYVRADYVREPIGDVSLDSLGARLAEELRRGLCDAADAKGRRATLALGEGTEVLAALWGAVARIRDLVTIRSGGDVRFERLGPEGALPLAPWMSPSEAHYRSSTDSRKGPTAGLGGTNIVVADDDPAVMWFLAGVLKTAGARVFEARDGLMGLDRAIQHAPDLIITDILMPGLDGFALCRALKRDVVLRDTPVILLSWKEDLLQRVRELGADADGYLRKEASAGAIVQRATELLRRRSRVAERIKKSGEVRGRLDGLTTTTLLRLVCAHRPSSTISVRDSVFLYEVEIRGGRPIRATRTTKGGSYDAGAPVLGGLLGVGDGRFSVTAVHTPTETSQPVGADLAGSLEEQLAPFVANARAAQRLLFGPALLRVERVVIDLQRLSSYFDATPEPARGLLGAMARGASPRQLIADGAASSRLVEDVLCDAAAHGAVVAVLDGVGVDALREARAEELARIRGERAPKKGQEPEAIEVAEGSLLAEALAVDPFAEEELTPSPSGPRAMEVAPNEDELSTAGTAAEEPAPAGAESDELEPQAETAGDEQAPPTETSRSLTASSGLEHPVDGLSPAPVGKTDPGVGPLFVTTTEAAAPADEDAPSAAPATADDDGVAQLFGGAAAPEQPVEADAAANEGALAAMQSVPIAIPAPAAAAEVAPAPPVEPDAESIDLFAPTFPPKPVKPAQANVPPGLQPMLTLGSLTPPPVDAKPIFERLTRRTATPKPPAVRGEEPSLPPAEESIPRIPRPSAFASPAKPKKVGASMRRVWWFAFAGVGIVFALWARWSQQDRVPEPTPKLAELPQVAAPVDPAAADAAAHSEPEPDALPQEEAEVEMLPLRPGDDVKKNEGMLEVVCGTSDTVYVDNKLIGSGPIVSLPLKAKGDPYEIRVKLRGEERVRYVVVEKQMLSRVRVAPPWSR